GRLRLGPRSVHGDTFQVAAIPALPPVALGCRSPDPLPQGSASTDAPTRAVPHALRSLAADRQGYGLPDRRAPPARRLSRAGASRPPRPPACLRDSPPESRAVPQGDRRLPGPPPPQYDAHLHQGGPPRTASGRRLRSGRVAMRLQSLIERYIAYRQALGQSFKTNAIILRAFGRAIAAH